MNFDYFTDPSLRNILTNSFHSKPVAVHIEAQGQKWLDGEPTRHGQLCADILGGPLWHEARGYDSGLLDGVPALSDAFLAAAQHPAVRLVTISMTYSRNHSVKTNGLETQGPLILKAVGNHAKDWAERRKHEAFSPLHKLSGFIRIGEATAPRRHHHQSQSSGPAFVCAHPFHIDPTYGFAFHPLQQEIDAFLNYARQEGYGCEPIGAAFSAGKIKTRKTGTSFSTPHAGAMIMRHTADLSSITAYDILPAVLMAAQDNRPVVGKLVRNGAGLVFDSGHQGFGFLDEPALADRLKQVWQCGRGTQPITRTAEGESHIEAHAADSERMVNVALELTFRTSHRNGKAENDVPLYVSLQSPCGTKIDLPLLIGREEGDAYNGSIRAGLQTTAFLGEDMRAGMWTIKCPFRLLGRYQIEKAEVTTHSIEKSSPAASILPSP